MKIMIAIILLGLGSGSGYRTEMGFVMNPETIITDDGNMWCYDTVANGIVAVVFDTNGTDEDITDDYIVKIMEM